MSGGGSKSSSMNVSPEHDNYSRNDSGNFNETRMNMKSTLSSPDDLNATRASMISAFTEEKEKRKSNVIGGTTRMNTTFVPSRKSNILKTANEEEIARFEKKQKKLIEKAKQPDKPSRLMTTYLWYAAVPVGFLVLCIIVAFGKGGATGVSIGRRLEYSEELFQI